jgi:hypothetical protein
MVLISGLFAPVTSALPVTEAPKMLTRFNFSTLTGGVVILHGLLGNFPDTLNFVLDTGSGGISLDSTTAEYLNVPLSNSDRTIRGIAGMRTVKFVVNQTLHLPGLTIDNLDFHTNDYQVLTSVYGVKIDGIIGYSFLSRYIVKMNYNTNTIEVWEPGKVRYPKGGYLLKTPVMNIPVVESTIKDGVVCKSKFYFDTGAGLCLLMSQAFAGDSSILSKGKNMLVTQAEGMGGKKTMKITTVKELKVGPYRFKKVPTHIFVDDYNVTSYPILGGLIGNDLFRRFNIVINYGQKEIHLLPNNHFSEPFDYSYTGLGIYFIDGHIVIEDVIEASPGEKAGLKPGDVIMGIGSNLSGNIQVYKNMLQTPKLKLKIIVVRNGQLLEKYLRVASIL